MLAFLRTIVRNLPTLLLAFILSMTVWISAVTAADPVVERPFPRTVPIEIIGQDPGLLLVSDPPPTVSVTLSAPRSVYDRLVGEQAPVRAVVDLSGLTAGTHTVPVQVTVSPPRMVNVVAYAPRTIVMELEAIASQTFPIRLVQRGDVAVGYQADTPVLNQRTATVSGPQSQVVRVTEVRAVLDMSRAQENIERQLNLVAVDASDTPVTGVNVNPAQVSVEVAITQRGGYRNVVVKVIVSGQVARGYRVTNISVFPPAVTVFSPDPRLIETLPGYVETSPLDLNNARDDLSLFLPLDLPPGVSVVGQEGAIADQFVEVQVGVAAIEGSLTIEDIPVQVTGVPEGLRASVSPETVAVILSGPLPVLERMTAQDVSVLIDVNGEEAGTYQLVPRVEFQDGELQVDSILPGSIEVTIFVAPRIEPRTTQTGTPTVITPTGTPTPRP